MENIRKLLSLNIRSAREEIEFSQQNLADEADISLRMEQDIEYGKAWPSPKVLEALSKALKKPTWWLLTDHRARKRDKGISYDDAFLMIDGFRKAEPDRRAVVLFLLTGDATHLDEIDDLEHVVEALNQAIE